MFRWALALLAATMVGCAPIPGINTHSFRVSTVSEFDMYREMNAAQDLGAKTVRVDVGWSSIEPTTKGVYGSVWTTRLDKLMQAADDRGMKVLVMLHRTPCWASTAPKDGQGNCTTSNFMLYPPTDPQDYADMAAYIADRHASKMAGLEVWNEPNLDTFFLAPNKPQAYVDLVRATYPRVKAVAPNVPVLAGSISYSDGVFLEQLYDAGLAGFHDGISFHPYTNNHPPSLVVQGQDRRVSYAAGVPWIRDIVAAHGELDKGLWLTEVGFSSCTHQTICTTSQGEYDVDLFELATQWPYVKQLILYELRDSGTDPADKQHNFGLLKPDFTPKPAFAEVKDFLNP